MPFPLRSLLGSIFLFFLTAIPFVHASWKHVALRGHGPLIKPEPHHRPKFVPGPLKQAHASFYEGGFGTFGGACGYEDIDRDAYGLDTAALSRVMFKNGETCGACYEIKCLNSSQMCKPGQPTIVVTATNLCPPNYYQESDNGRWCNPPREHFDLAESSYLKIAALKGGIVPVQYRRVPCKRQGGIRFTITGNPYYNLVKVWNVGGAGDVVRVQVKGDDKLKWTDLKRHWGQKWETDATLVGQALSFRVRASDGRYSASWRVTPKNWQFGQTYQGKNFS
ncbi:hypothetical protein L6164_033745 [Bauhinia variegata]|uniref:Uncharacterized protein n=1 Tax=Bauhinia variegata TaxID=167791 RepID=A0ACB9KSZ0_BAUVA|nr:hypothetical protein L6164_033745 [Bauhinia variegata]